MFNPTFGWKKHKKKLQTSQKKGELLLHCEICNFQCVNLALANPSMLISRLLFCLRMASSSAKIFKESTDAMLSCGPRPAGRRGPRETCAFGESEIRTVYFSNINLTRKIRSSQEKVGTTPLVELRNKRGACLQRRPPPGDRIIALRG